MINWLAIFIVLFSGLNHSLVLAKELEINVVTEHLPPYQYINNKQQLDGYSTDVVKELLSRLKCDCPISVLPWARAYKYALSRPNLIIFSMARTQLREDKFHWIGELYQEEYAFFTIKENTDITADTLDDIRKYYVGVTLNSGVEQFLTDRKFHKLERTNSVQHAFQMLFSRRVDLMFGDEFVFKRQVFDMGEEPTRLKKILPVPEINSDLYIAMSLSSSSELVAKVRQEFQLMQAQGDLLRIKKKWNM